MALWKGTRDAVMVSGFFCLVVLVFFLRIRSDQKQIKQNAKI